MATVATAGSATVAMGAVVRGVEMVEVDEKAVALLREEEEEESVEVAKEALPVGGVGREELQLVPWVG